MKTIVRFTQIAEAALRALVEEVEHQQGSEAAMEYLRVLTDLQRIGRAEPRP